MKYPVTTMCSAIANVLLALKLFGDAPHVPWAFIILTSACSLVGAIYNQAKEKRTKEIHAILHGVPHVCKSNYCIEQ